MIWSSLLLTTALLSQSNGLFDSNSLEAGDEPYWVGDPYNVSWTGGALGTDVVNVVLRYGPNLESKWTIISDQNNTDMEHYNLMLGADLSDSVGQLLITNGTMGQFRLEIPSYLNNSNMTTSSYNLSNVIPCYQTVVISTVQGRVIQAGEGFSVDDFRVFVRKETYLNVIGANEASWVADFVNVNVENFTWTLADPLQLPTVAPTLSPTVAPTMIPTMMPTINNTNGNGTNGSNPIAVASLTGGSKQSLNGNTATTPSPTTVYTTGKRHSTGRRLMQSLSLRDITLGLNDNNNNDDNVELGCNILTTGTWCEFRLKLTIPATVQPGGPFFLVVGVESKNNTNSPLQYYGVNGNGNALDTVNQFVVYNPSNLALDLNYTFMNESLFYKYENVAMSVSLGDNVTNPEVFVVLVNPVTDAKYYLECMPHLPEYYTSFGWRTTAEDGVNNTLPSGGYQFELYWGAIADSFIETVASPELYRFEDVGTLPFVRITNEFNGTSATAVTIDKNKFNKGKTAKVLFETSFNSDVNLTGYIQQCDYTQTNYSMNDTGPCHDYTDSMFSFTYTPGERVSVSFPKKLYKTNLNNNETVTNLIISADLCTSGNELSTIIPVSISSKSSKSNGLSAGAIVGIVCAGVLVLGLAAWWLCMKKGGGDQYRELEG